MIKVRIRKPLIEEDLLVEDIKNLGLPPIIVTTILGEFSGQSFDTKKSQDVIGRMYKEKSKLSQGIVSSLVDDINDAIEFTAEMGEGDHGGLVPEEFTQGFNKIVKYNIMSKSNQEFFDFKELKSLEKSLNKLIKKYFGGTVEKESLRAVEDRFAEKWLYIYGIFFQGLQTGATIINYLKKHPSNWKDLARLGYDEAVEFVKEARLTQEDEKDIVYKYDDGYYWINLGEGACELEAARMGHCGRDDRGNLVSLRIKPKGSKISKSYVTLSYNSHNDTIYQAKGRGNNAPDPNHWEHIVHFINHFGVGYMEETGEHSNDDFTDFIEYVARETDAEVDTTLRELESLIQEINNGNHNTPNIVFSAEIDAWGDDPYALFDAYVNMEVEIEVPGNNYDVADKMEDIMASEESDILEKIAEIDYLENYIEDYQHHISLDYSTRDSLDGPDHMLVKIAMAPQLENHSAANAEALMSMIEDIQYNFGSSDIESFEENIKNIIMDYMADVITTPGSEKYREIHGKIEEIENGFKHFYAEYNLDDYREGIEFVLSKTLRVTVPPFPYQMPRGWNDYRMNINAPRIGDYASKLYDKSYRRWLQEYERTIRRYFSDFEIVRILNGAFNKFSSDAAFYAQKQTRLEFPGFDLSDLDNEFKTDAMSPFDKDHVHIRYPSTGQLQQKTEAFGKPTFGFKSIIGINWTDNIEQVLFVMEYVQYLDKHWKDIEDLVTPIVENIAVKVKKIHKQFWNQFRVELQDVVDDANKSDPDRTLALEENKQKIKVLLKK